VKSQASVLVQAGVSGISVASSLEAMPWSSYSLSIRGCLCVRVASLLARRARDIGVGVEVGAAAPEFVCASGVGFGRLGSRANDMSDPPPRGRRGCGSGGSGFASARLGCWLWSLGQHEALSVARPRGRRGCRSGGSSFCSELYGVSLPRGWPRGRYVALGFIDFCQFYL
jgi:hypothetical protein